MPINEKIINEIKNNQVWDEKYKELLIKILSTEETTYRYKKDFENHVNEYLKKGSDAK